MRLKAYGGGGGTHNWTGDLLHLYFLHYKTKIDISNDEHYHVSTRLEPDNNFAAIHCLNREAAEYWLVSWLAAINGLGNKLSGDQEVALKNPYKHI